MGHKIRKPDLSPEQYVEKYNPNREEAVRENASRRMRRVKEMIPLPPKSPSKIISIAYKRDGTYIGVVKDEDLDDVDPSWIIKRQKAI